MSKGRNFNKTYKNWDKPKQEYIYQVTGRSYDDLVRIKRLLDVGVNIECSDEIRMALSELEEEEYPYSHSYDIMPQKPSDISRIKIGTMLYAAPNKMPHIIRRRRRIKVISIIAIAIIIAIMKYFLGRYH